MTLEHHLTVSHIINFCGIMRVQWWLWKKTASIRLAFQHRMKSRLLTLGMSIL
jgi:hypothetical protein